MTDARLPWQAIAIISGCFAALNGVFAKLTTADTTHDVARWIVEKILILEVDNRRWESLVEAILRLVVLVSSFVVSAAMWALYTRALACAPSAIQANVLNTSANFVLAALAGMVLFGEKLESLWWVGASLLIAGTVIIGKRTTESHQTKTTLAKKQD